MSRRRKPTERAKAPVYFYRFTTPDFPDAVTFGISAHPTLRAFFYAYDGPFTGFTDLHVFPKVGHGEVFEDTLKRWTEAMVRIPREGRWTESYHIDYHEVVTAALLDHGAIRMALPPRQSIVGFLPSSSSTWALGLWCDGIRSSADPEHDLNRYAMRAIRSGLYCAEDIGQLGHAALGAGLTRPQVERIISVSFSYLMSPLQPWETVQPALTRPEQPIIA